MSDDMKIKRKTTSYNFRCTPEFKRLLVFIAERHFGGSLTTAIETSIRHYARHTEQQEPTTWTLGKHRWTL